MFVPSSFTLKNKSSKSAGKKGLSMDKSMNGAKKSNLLAMSGMKAKKSMPKANPSTTSKRMQLLNPLGGAMGRMSAKGTTMKKNMLGAAKKMTAKAKFFKAMGI